MKMDKRSLPLEVRDFEESDAGHFAWLRVVNWDVPDRHNTSWRQDVFDQSLQRKLPKFVFSHQIEPLNVIGRATEYTKDSTGLDVRVRFSDFDANPDARRMYHHLKDEEIDEVSFGFTSHSSEPDPNNRGVTRFTRADMHEVSPVLVASGYGTSVRDVRSGLFVPQDNKFTIMRRSPHPSRIVDSECVHCGETEDFRAHTTSREVITLRDLTATLAADPILSNDASGLVSATDTAIDAAIALASTQDLTNCPPWVAQFLSLVMAADATVDAAAQTLNLEVPDVEVTDSMARAFDVAESRSDPDQDMENMLARLDSLSKRTRK